MLLGHWIVWEGTYIKDLLQNNDEELESMEYQSYGLNVTDDRLFIFHIVFWILGAMNDFNVLVCSPFFSLVRASIWTNENPELSVAGLVFDWLHCVVDGINPLYRKYIIQTPSTKGVKHLQSHKRTFEKMLRD